MSRTGAAPRAAVSVSNPRAEASRQERREVSAGRTRPKAKRASDGMPLKHGPTVRRKHLVVLPDEDGAAFADLEAALLEELAPVGALQSMLARGVAVAAWRLARADPVGRRNGVGAPFPDSAANRSSCFAERHIAGGGVGLALIRDGNGTRSFETLLRYRGAAMAEFWRALWTSKTLGCKPSGRADAGLRPGGARHRGAPPEGTPAGARRTATARPPSATERTRAPS